MNSPLVDVRDISFVHKGVALLHNITLHLFSKQLVGIIGPNGAGKSTLLKLVSGFLKPTSGSIALNGKPLNTYTPKQLAQKMAVLYPEQPFAFPMPVSQYVSLGRTPYLNWLGVLSKEDKDVIHDVLEKCGIFHLKEQLIQTLSSGEFQKVQVARALAQNPELLILDEPTSHLDLQAQMQLMHLLKEQLSHTTILLVIHDLNLASLFCHHLIFLCQGQCLVQGTPREVLTEENLAKVYGIYWKILTDSESQKPFLIPATFSE